MRPRPPANPTIAALQPNILLQGSVTTSGFLAKVTPAGDGFIFSTYIAGSGITGAALDASTGSLLLTGNVSLGQFPVATVAMPLTSATYQSLLRIPLDGQSVSQSVLLAAGSTAHVSASTDGAWISGMLTTPLFSGITPPDYNAGDSFLLHVTTAGAIDQTLRFGGEPINNPSYASLTSSVAAPAVKGTAVFVPGQLTASVSSSLLATQRFDLPLVNAPNPVLPNALRDILPTSAACAGGSMCSGTGAFLARAVPSSASASLGIAIDDIPNLTLRNLSSVAATGLNLSATGYSLASNCGPTLNVSSLCSVSLSGSGPGVLTVTSTGNAAINVALPATTAAPEAVTLSASELDFGVVAPSSPSTQTVTVTNLGVSTRTFASTMDTGVNTGYTLTQSSTDCTTSGSPGSYFLGPGGSCHITLQLAFASATSSSSVLPSWKIGSRDLIVKGYLQTAALSTSVSEVDFGDSGQWWPGCRTPALYLLVQ